MLPGRNMQRTERFLYLTGNKMFCSNIYATRIYEYFWFAKLNC